VERIRVLASDRTRIRHLPHERSSRSGRFDLLRSSSQTSRAHRLSSDDRERGYDDTRRARTFSRQWERECDDQSRSYAFDDIRIRQGWAGESVRARVVGGGADSFGVSASKKNRNCGVSLSIYLQSCVGLLSHDIRIRDSARDAIRSKRRCFVMYIFGRSNDIERVIPF
jgi:hypothetical protein